MITGEKMGSIKYDYVGYEVAEAMELRLCQR